MHIDSMVRRASHEATPWRNCLSDTMESVRLFHCIIVNAMLPCSTVIERWNLRPRSQDAGEI